MAKIDPYNHERRYLAWKEKTKNGIPDISKKNSDLVKQFLNDMELGLNVSNKSKKGARSYIRLNTLRDKFTFFSLKFKEHFNLDIITNINEEQIHRFFAEMRNGKILKKDGYPYKSVNYYVKSFKSFWHWHMKVHKKKGIEIPDISVDLDASGDKPEWVYVTEEQVKKLCDNAKYEYKVLIMFLFDSGLRTTEFVNVKVGDFYEDFKKLNVRDETSKTFGRKINLLLSNKLIKEYVKENDLKDSDLLFSLTPPAINQYLKRLATRILGDTKSPAGQKYSWLTIYDLRHSSTCYWLPKYKSELALKYRFGWKKSEMVYYYTEFLGMKDTISEEDMLVDVTKTEIERRLSQSEKNNQLLQERLTAVEQILDKAFNMTGEVEVKAQELLVQQKIIS